MDTFECSKIPLTSKYKLGVRYKCMVYIAQVIKLVVMMISGYTCISRGDTICFKTFIALFVFCKGDTQLQYVWTHTMVPTSISIFYSNGVSSR